MEFPYISKGESVLKCIVSEERDKFLAKASLADLTKYIPKIDFSKNVQFLGIAFNAFVANRVNKNDDACDSKTAVELAKLFVNNCINVEHKRDRVVGFILNYAFTKFGSDEPLTEEEALATTDPFNVTLGGVIWRIVNPDLANYVEKCSDPTDENYEKISTSWEIGFTDLNIAEINGESKNLSDAKIITDSKEVDKIKEYLKAYGGKGYKGDISYYRILSGDTLPLGIGLTNHPAADVKGIATSKTEEVKNEGKESTDAERKSTDADLDKNKETAKNISQNKENNVIEERKVSMSVKITKIEDITDGLLKEATASQITDWIKEQLKTADETFTTEKNKLQNEVTAAKEAQEKLVAEQTKLQEDLKKINASLETLQKEKEARAKQDSFNTRMAALDSEFDLTEAEREVIASDIASFDDTAFDGYKKKLDVLLAAKKKCAKSAEKPGEKKEEKPGMKEEKEEKECKASTETTTEAKTVVENAIDNSEKDKAKLAAAATAQPASIIDKFQKAFGLDQWISDIKLTD